MPDNLTFQHLHKTSDATLPIFYSCALREALTQEKNAQDASRLPYFPRFVLDEAKSTLETAHRTYLSPPRPEQLRHFVTDLYDALNIIVRNPASTKELKVRTGITCQVLADVPRLVLSKEFHTLCFSRCKFLPAPADVLELVDEFTKPWREKVNAIKLLISHDQCKRFTLGKAPPLDDESITNPNSSQASTQHITTADIVAAFPNMRRRETIS